MSEPRYQITYTATLDEMIETTLAVQTRTKATQRGKRRGQLFMAGYLALAAAIIFMLRTHQVTWEAFGVLLPIALIFVGVPVYLLWGLYLGWCVRRGVAKIIAEKWGGDGTVCANEFLDEQLCVKQGGIEIRLAWGDLSEIEERPDAVMLWFGLTLVRFPNRIFANNSERERLIRAAQELWDRAGGGTAG